MAPTDDPVVLNFMETGHNYGPTILSDGSLQYTLRNSIIVQIAEDCSVKLLNDSKGTFLCLSHDGSSATIKSPNAMVNQCGQEIVVAARHQKSDVTYYGKFLQRAITFTTNKCAVSFTVDTNGTRVAQESFYFGRNFDGANSMHNSFEDRYGDIGSQLNLLDVKRRSKFTLTSNGVARFELNGIHMYQTADGLVNISRLDNKYYLWNSPNTSSTGVCTDYMYCTSTNAHLFVRRQELRIHFDGDTMSARNTKTSASINEHNVLRVY